MEFKSTEEHLAEAAKQIQMAVLGGEVLRLTHGFTGDSGRQGFVACYVVIPDAEIEELRERLDEEIARYLAERGYGVLTNTPIQ